VIGQEVADTSRKRKSYILGGKTNHESTQTLEQAAWRRCGTCLLGIHTLTGHSLEHPVVIGSTLGSGVD